MSDSNNSKTPLFLIPSWGADRRVWHHQLQADFGSVEPIVPDWLDPEQGESLASYAARLARSINPGGPCYLAGHSFGGMLAVEMASHLDARACILIATIPSGDRLPRRYHLFRRLIRYLPASIWWAPRVVIRLHLLLFRRFLSENRRLVYDQFLDTPPRFFHWTARAILGWQRQDAPLPCPSYHLHGDADQILPIRYVEPDRVLPGAGHCLPLVRPDEVNQFIAGVVNKAGS